MHLVKGFLHIKYINPGKKLGDWEERKEGTPAASSPRFIFSSLFFFFFSPLYCRAALLSERLELATLWIVFKMYPFFICVNFI